MRVSVVLLLLAACGPSRAPRDVPDPLDLPPVIDRSAPADEPAPGDRPGATDVPAPQDVPSIFDASADVSSPQDAPSITDATTDLPSARDVVDAGFAADAGDPSDVGDLLRCDPRGAICAMPPPVCTGGGEVPSVNGGCWGPCVVYTRCAPIDCDPDVMGACPQNLVCYRTTRRCGPFL